MPHLNVYAFDDYKTILRKIMGERTLPGDESLTLAMLARKTGYQRSFYSRVINGVLQLTPEAAYKVSTALNFSEHERSYFMLLVEKARAGTPDYLQYIEGKITQMRNEHEHSQKAFRTPVSSDESHFSSYLSSWSWVAIHLATSIPDLQTPSQISERLGLPVHQVHEVLHALERIGFVERTKEKFKFRTGAVHISDDSPWVQFHHSNWRLKALQDAQTRNPRSIHYTNILTLTPYDRDVIRARLLRTIEEVMKIASPSNPEDLVCLNVDFFSV